MVSTQTSLTCSRNDNLLPQTLLYNIITAKLTEAFELTNLHAKLCDYSDNLRSIKKEPTQATYQFTNNYPDVPHLDLVLPSNQELQSPSSQGCFSPNSYLPRKRQRLHSVSPATAVHETIGLSAPSSLTCPNCKSTYKSVGGLNYHIKRCQTMVFSKPLTNVCKQLSFEPENPIFTADVPVGMPQTDNGDKTKEPKENKQSDHVMFLSEKDQSPGKSPDEVLVAYLVDNCNIVGQDTNIIKPSDSKNSVSSKETENSFKAPTRKSTRIKTATHRQIRSKLLFERIKKVKQQSIARQADSKLKKTSNTTKRKYSPKKKLISAPADKKSKKEVGSEMINVEEQRADQNEILVQQSPAEKKYTNPRNEDVTGNNAKENLDVKQTVTKPSIPCKQCNCVFQSRWNARRHEYTVHGIGTPLTSDDLASRQSGTECMECKKSPVDIPPNSTDEETAWVCGICGKNLQKKELLIEHKKSHEKLEPPTPNEQGMYVCKVCFKKYESGVSLINHVNRQHNPTLTCAVCYKILPSQIALSSHSCSSDVKISCRHCPKTFKSHSDHVKHVRNVHASLTHSLNQSACRLCNYTFSSALKYRVHQTISHPTHDLRCQLCNLVQGSRDELIDHVLKHHATLPFLCTVCEMGFESQDAMTRHRSEHFK